MYLVLTSKKGNEAKMFKQSWKVKILTNHIFKENFIS